MRIMSVRLTGDVRSSVVRTSEYESEDPGFHPVAGRRVKAIVMSFRVNSCADLFVTDLPSCVRHAPKFVRTLKIPYPSVVKE